MPPDPILLNKAAIIERCMRRIREEHAADPDLQSPTHVDALTLNVQRACQACIDLAMHVVATEHLGVPQSSGEAFALLGRAGLVDKPLSKALQGMTGFRNVAVHEYQELDPEVLTWIITDGMSDWVSFCRAMGLTIAPPPPR